jgi:DNA-binding NarL/FixJ family response regulator
MIKTIFLDNDNDFILNFKNIIKVQKTIKIIETVNSNEKCLESFIANNPSLIIINFDNTAFDGLHLIRELLQMSKSLKVILITTGIQISVIKQLKKYQNIVILYKPFNLTMLNEKIQQIGLLK